MRKVEISSFRKMAALYSCDKPEANAYTIPVVMAGIATFKQQL
jgi:hypothetical protein